MQVILSCNVSPSRPSRVFPSGREGGCGGLGGSSSLPEKLACPPPLMSSPHVLPTVLTQKCRFYNFHAVFGHFPQIVPPHQSTPFGKPCQDNITLRRLFSCKNMYVSPEPILHKYFSCAMLSQTYLDNIEHKIFLCDVVSA